VYPESEQSISTHNIKSFLTVSNIQYLVQGLEVLLQNDLDGDQRAKVIELRDELVSNLNFNSIFEDYR
jgi:hypothetical protein